MINVGQLQIFRQLIMEFDFQQILQLQETKILIAKPDLLIPVQTNIRPLPKKPFETERWNSLLQWLADIVADRIKNR